MRRFTIGTQDTPDDAPPIVRSQDVTLGATTITFTFTNPADLLTLLQEATFVEPVTLTLILTIPPDR